MKVGDLPPTSAWNEDSTDGANLLSVGRRPYPHGMVGQADGG